MTEQLRDWLGSCWGFWGRVSSLPFSQLLVVAGDPQGSLPYAGIITPISASASTWLSSLCVHLFSLLIQWLHFHWLHLQRPYFQLKSYSLVSEVRMWTYLLGEDTIQPKAGAITKVVTKKTGATRFARSLHTDLFTFRETNKQKVFFSFSSLAVCFKHPLLAEFNSWEHGNAVCRVLYSRVEATHP